MRNRVLKILFKEDNQEELINLLLLEKMETEKRLKLLAIKFLEKLNINIDEIEFKDGKYKKITKDCEIRFILQGDKLILKGEVCFYKSCNFYKLFSDGFFIKTIYPYWDGAQKRYAISYRRF